MNLDIGLQIGSIALTVLLAYVGVEMANNPPTVPQQKWKYRIVFVVFGLLLIGVNYWQGVRNAAEQAAIKVDAAKETKTIQSQYDQLQGQFQSINGFMQHPPAGLTQAQVANIVKTQIAEAVRTMIPGTPPPATVPQTTANPTAPTTPSAPIAPDTQALKEQGLQMAKEINDWITTISQDAPSALQGGEA